MNKNLNDFQFNDYIFLNTDFLESFVSQRYNGFPKEMQILMGAEYALSYNGEKTTTEADIGANVGFGPFGGNGTYKESNEGSAYREEISPISKRRLLERFPPQPNKQIRRFGW